jgi:hypothetical protein
MPKSFPAIHFLLSQNLARYPKDSEEEKKLSTAIRKFEESHLQESSFEDPQSIAALNEVLQTFLNADKREVSLKASEEGRSEEHASKFEELLDAFNLRKEIPLPNPAGKTIAIFGANLVSMRLRAKWLFEHLEKYPGERPQIIFLTGDRAAFTHVEEERKILNVEIAAKISSTPEAANLIVEEGIKAAKGIATSPQHLQAIIPLAIMKEVNKRVPGAYILEGLDDFDLLNNAKAVSLLKTALSARIYPSETTMAAVVATEYGLNPVEALLPADKMGKEYRATTKDNANVLLKKIQIGECSKQVILVSNNPFCERQGADVVSCAENLEERIEGLKLEVCGSKHVNTEVNSATTLDVLARHVYAINQLYQDRLKRSAAKAEAAAEAPAPSPAPSGAGQLSGVSAELGAGARV